MNTNTQTLREAVNALLHQIDIGDFVDSNGHSAKMLKPVHDLMLLLSQPPAPEQASDGRCDHHACLYPMCECATPTAEPGGEAVAQGWKLPSGTKVVDKGFRWVSEEQHHVPQIVVEFDPVPANSPCDAKGWADRDQVAAMLSASPAAPVADADTLRQCAYPDSAATGSMNFHDVLAAELGVIQQAPVAAKPVQQAQAGEPEVVAWEKGYRQGVLDERESEANIGVAGFSAKVEPSRENPYTRPQQAAQVAQPLTEEQQIEIMERLGITVYGPAAKAVEALIREVESAHGIGKDQA